VLDVQQLRRVETIQQLLTFSDVLPLVGEMRNPLFLLRNVPLAFGDVPIGLFQMPEQHRAVHETVYTTSKACSFAQLFFSVSFQVTEAADLLENSVEGRRSSAICG